MSVSEPARALAEHALEAGAGVLRLAPAWVPRSFCRPGGRLRLHPNDLLAYGAARGGIDERWLASTVEADNGPQTTEHEGLSEVVVDGGRRGLLLRDVVGELDAFAKLFDNQGPLPFHVHPTDEQVAALGRRGKPEAYVFPPQLNPHPGDFPHTFFGLVPGTSPDDVRERLARFSAGDNRITELSVAHRLTLGDAWSVPAGVLHAPGSLCTYEPQAASDTAAMLESVADDRAIDESMLWGDVVPERHGDLDAILELVDWEANLAPDFAARHRIAPVALPARDGVAQRWVVHGMPGFSAKEVTVAPGASTVLRDGAAHGVLCIQGRGTLGTQDVGSPTLVRFGELTEDELYVTEDAARAGVRVENLGALEPLVLLQHFGPGAPGAPEPTAAAAGR
jgi:hypothetical protein